MFTQRHFIRIAEIFAKRELDIENRYDHYQDANQRAIQISELESMIGLFVMDFRATNPRFNEAKFRVAARPIFAAAKRARIAHAVGMNVQPLPGWMKDLPEFQK